MFHTTNQSFISLRHKRQDPEVFLPAKIIKLLTKPGRQFSQQIDHERDAAIDEWLPIKVINYRLQRGSPVQRRAGIAAGIHAATVNCIVPVP